MAGYPGGYGGYPGQTPGYGAPSGPGQYGGQYPQQQGYPPQQPSYPPGGYGGPPSAAYGAPPGADPTLWNWFIAVDRDRSGAISSDELEQALMNNNWSRFNQETCRLMIGFGESIGLRIGAFIGMFTTLDKYSDGRTMKKFKSLFDHDQSGTINFQEFQQLWSYIQQWKGSFDRYDTDRSGNISGQELHTALAEMGFRVSPQFISLVLIKFDRAARSSLKFDDFIQCCVMIRMLTDAFRARDTNMNGVIQINYEDFMQMVLLNKP